MYEEIPRFVAEFGDTLVMEDFYAAAYSETPAHSDDIHEMIIANPDLEIITDSGGKRYAGAKEGVIGVGVGLSMAYGGPILVSSVRALVVSASELAVETSPVWANPVNTQRIIDFSTSLITSTAPAASTSGALAAVIQTTLELDKRVK